MIDMTGSAEVDDQFPATFPDGTIPLTDNAAAPARCGPDHFQPCRDHHGRA